jgi:hypothetical protein
VGDTCEGLAISRCRTDMFRALIRLDIGVNQVEDYNAALNLQLKSNLFKGRCSQGNREVVRVAMEYKLKDSIQTTNELSRVRDGLRRKLKLIYGNKTVTTRKILKDLQARAEETRREHREDYKNKIDHLSRKFERKRNEENRRLPEDMKEYSLAMVFDKGKYEAMKIDQIDVTVIGQVDLSEDEKALLRLHPKFSIRDDLTVENLEFEQELGYAKARYELRRENEENLEEEIDLYGGTHASIPTFSGIGTNHKTENEPDVEKIAELSELEEAKARQFYDPEENVYDYRKKKVTDLRENSRVTLPSPVTELQEAGIAIRRETFNGKVRDYMRKNCNEKNQQKPNLTKSESNGLRSLQKRIKSGELVIMSTDKSSKLAVTNMSTYMEMGEVHTRADKEISRESFTEVEKVINGHTSMHIKMQGMGENWGHGKRMRGSTITRSQNLASLRLLLKDHKKELKTRQVVSGNESNTVGLSNIMSDLVESLANAIENPGEVISSEDLLSKIHECNLVLEKRRKDVESSGEVWNESEKDLYILGSDVVALFPSITAVKTGRVAMEPAIKSTMKIEGMDYMEMARYAHLGERDGLTSGVEEVRRLLPVRNSTRGTGPGFKNK